MIILLIIVLFNGCVNHYLGLGKGVRHVLHNALVGSAAIMETGHALRTWGMKDLAVVHVGMHLCLGWDRDRLNN